ncbi:MAG: PLP-dependent aminotransferase family protein [Pseudomonadales bacterium]|nr:PLP-dependent aminotransferase family protein [Pseudomonadales bacterium]
MIETSANRQQRSQFESISVNPESKTAIFRQLEEQIREAIWSGKLKAGERLPSTRQLAQDLVIARNTVVNAYEQLMVEGFIETIKGSGTRVTDNFPERSIGQFIEADLIDERLHEVTLSIRYQELMASNLALPQKTGTTARAFRAHTPACKEFPSQLWSKLMTRRLRQQPELWMEACPSVGYAPLREAISAYLGAARGLSTEADKIIITAGAQQAVELLAKILIDPGDIVCFEDPGYTHAAQVFKMAGANIVNIPVDEQGLDVAKLKSQVKKAKLVYTTPSSHFPLGVTMSQSRRAALLQWASESGAMIVEDDYNGEYRYRGRPLATLHSMRNDDNVIYIGSFSKLLFPALRLGYMVVPEALIKPLSTVRWLLDRHSPPLEQAVLTDFINEGHFSRHLRKMRNLYAQRQQVLLKAAQDYLADILRVDPLDGGLHLVGYLQPGIDEQRLLEAAERANIEIMPTSLFSVRHCENPSIILGYAPYSEKDIISSAKKLAKEYYI